MCTLADRAADYFTYFRGSTACPLRKMLKSEVRPCTLAGIAGAPDNLALIHACSFAGKNCIEMCIERIGSHRYDG